MSKELPYFKFFSAEWISGDVTLEDYETQGMFINLCALYWQKDCNLSIKQTKRLHGLNLDALSNLIEIDGDRIVIEFLDEQYKEFDKNHRRNVENGKKGAEKRWKDRGANSGANGDPIALREDKEEDKSKKYVLWINDEFNRNFRHSDKIRKQYNARVKQGYTEKDFAKAVRTAYADEFHRKNNFKYLTPEFFTREDKLEKWLNTEAKPLSKKQQAEAQGDYTTFF